MAARSSEFPGVRIRLISEAAPPKEHDGRPTAFGLKDKKRDLHPGLELPDGSVQLDLEIQAKLSGPSEPIRYYGSFVLGPTGEQYIGLIWNYTDEPQTIRGQKVRLDTLPWKLVDQAARRGDLILQAQTIPVTEKTATIPVEWTSLPVDTP